MAIPLPAAKQHEGEYEDLLSLWSDLETALSLLLSKPLLIHDFPGKLRQLDVWLQDLVAHDTDAALYLMFQLAATSTASYSASHALVCATLCHILAQELKLPAAERDSLVCAALTMNIGMTALQDQLAQQREKPTPQQQEAIQNHPLQSQALLRLLQLPFQVAVQHRGHLQIHQRQRGQHGQQHQKAEQRRQPQAGAAPQAQRLRGPRRIGSAHAPPSACRPMR